MTNSDIGALPTQPKVSRRGSFEFYEIVFFMIWLLALFVGALIIFSAYVDLPEIIDFATVESLPAAYMFFGITLIMTVVLHRFDSVSRKTAGENYEYEMSHFKSMREEFLELRRQELEIERKKVGSEWTIKDGDAHTLNKDIESSPVNQMLLPGEADDLENDPAPDSVIE